MTPPNSNPFDFSDFGGRAPATAHSPRLQAGRRRAGGFDPFAGQSPVALDAQGSGEVFAASAATGRPDTLAVAGPPLILVAIALGIAVVGSVLGIAAVTIDSTVALAFFGWLLAGPAAIGVLAAFSSLDTRRRISSVYSAPTWLPTAYWTVVATCAFGIAVGAWQIALWAGRQ